jgi:hypothetical protein
VYICGRDGVFDGVDDLVLVSRDGYVAEDL